MYLPQVAAHHIITKLRIIILKMNKLFTYFPSCVLYQLDLSVSTCCVRKMPILTWQEINRSAFCQGFKWLSFLLSSLKMWMILFATRTWKPVKPWMWKVQDMAPAAGYSGNMLSPNPSAWFGKGSRHSLLIYSLVLHLQPACQDMQETGWALPSKAQFHITHLRGTVREVHVSHCLWDVPNTWGASTPSWGGLDHILND